MLYAARSHLPCLAFSAGAHVGSAPLLDVSLLSQEAVPLSKFGLPAQAVRYFSVRTM